MGQTAKTSPNRFRNVATIVRAVANHHAPADLQANGSVEAARQFIATIFRAAGDLVLESHAKSPHINGPSARPKPLNHTPPVPDAPHLSRRLWQTLDGLLDGESEKQIASRLKLSPHTIHVYVKALYRSFAVNSRGELLAKFVNRPTLP